MLNEYRKNIDEIDKKLVKLFEERMDTAKKVGEYKKARNMDVLNSAREAEVLKSRVSLLENKDYAPYAEDFFEHIMSLSRKLQSGIVKNYEDAPSVCYCGDPGCYAEEAGAKFFGEGAKLYGTTSFAEVFKTVETGGVEYGVLPIENTSTGFIRDVLDLLATYNCNIVGETAISIRHCLLGIEGSKLCDIREIYSHEQGISQSSEFLSELTNVKTIPYINTATSAKYVANSGDKTKAAIASERAAILYGLAVLKKNINQKTINTTRFIIISKENTQIKDADKISVAFRLEHKSGSLCRVLSHFSGAGLNLMHIESRPLVDKNYEYLFHVDFSGNLSQECVQEALGKVKGECTMLKVFGNYKSCKQEGAGE